MVPNVHGGGNHEDRLILFLAAVYIGRQLLLTEHIKNAMMTDPISAAKITMGVIIRHAPANGSGYLGAFHHLRKDFAVAQRMRHSSVLRIAGFCGKHVAIEFCHKIRSLTGENLRGIAEPSVLPIMDKIIIGIDIFKKLALLEISDATGGSRLIIKMGNLVHFTVKGGVILGLIDSHPPKDDGWMVPVSPNHPFQIILADLLELLISYVLPSWDLFKHKEPQSVAGIQEPFGLRVMGGSYQMDTKVLLQDLCIQLLHGFGHGVSHVGIALMPVQPSQFQLFSIEIESIFFEKRLTESDPHNPFI